MSNKTKLIGALYLENNLNRAFTSDRLAVLELLASRSRDFPGERQHSVLQRSGAYPAQGQSMSHTGSFG
jgi:hypothetical protein